ncbi:Uncharacterised protein [Mycobacteroides abscessus subsp. abscessus]|nr:Uncharacterised protein [Mycobacteroides abscessus subsp. abscessus]
MVRRRACKVPTERWQSWHSCPPADACPHRAQLGVATGSEINRARPPHDCPQVRTWLDFGTNDCPQTTQSRSTTGAFGITN